ncbi:2378_t:CDS:1, partial [Ambispora leptoticha]
IELGIAKQVYQTRPQILIIMPKSLIRINLAGVTIGSGEQQKQGCQDNPG